MKTFFFVARGKYGHTVISAVSDTDTGKFIPKVGKLVPEKHQLDLFPRFAPNDKYRIVKVWKGEELLFNSDNVGARTNLLNTLNDIVNCVTEQDGVPAMFG